MIANYPMDIENEEALVSSVIADGSWANSIGISKTDFSDPELGELFEIIQNLHAMGEPATGQNLFNAITTSGLKHRGLDVSRLGRMLENRNIEVAHARLYAERLRSESTRRKFTTELSNMLDAVSKLPPGNDISNRMSELRVCLDALESRKTIAIKSAGQIAHESIREKQAPRSHPVFTGLERYDCNFGGFCGGDLAILAARTSIGKTALALGIAEHNARKGRPVLYVTLEMRDQELIDRVLCRLSECSSLAMRDCNLTASDFDRLSDAAESLQDLKLYVYDPPSAKVSRIRAAARLTQSRHGLSVLVVDYINRVTPDDRGIQRHEQIAQISRDLKTLAKELNIPVFVLAQINRSGERDNAEPALIHLKESGAIEEDADQVLLLHREHRQSTSGKLILAKNRHGATDAIELEFSGPDIQFRCKSLEWAG